MRTLIIQSYRTHNVASWISDCMHSVRAWADERSYEYEFVDDHLFDYAPGWVRQLCGAKILPITDVARMYLLREYLQRGWDRVVWVDADVLVFASQKFVLDDAAPYSLCRELSVYVNPEREVRFDEMVNNAVLLVTPRQPMLDFWIFAVEEILRDSVPDEIDSLTAGTRFFTNVAMAMPVRVLQNIGLFTPPLIRDIAAGGGALLEQWVARFGRPIGAANLCASMQDREYSGARVGAADMQRAVEVLLNTRGELVNRWTNLTLTA